ncbi:MAG: FAD-dependent oxidoreductase [Acidobacteriaceae bacterium]
MKPSQLLAEAACPANLPENACPLPRVHISPDREIRTVVGLRPYRPSGFRVEAEKFGEKLVVHNYGHGGGGITLSWGTSKLAVELGLSGYVGPVAVLGCGAVGLATARLVQEAGFPVTIYAKALPPETTSNIAGGQWFPVNVFDPDREMSPLFNQQFLAACRYSYQRYQMMTAPRYGIRWMRNYVMGNKPFKKDSLTGPCSPIRDLLPELRDLKPYELPFRDIRYARQFDCMLIEPPMYLPAMLTDVRIAGGSVVVRELNNTEELQGLPEKLIFNCTGLGAKALFGDEEMTPIRGQLTFLLPQPEVTYATGMEGTYMFSRRDGILLGGTHDEGDWSLEPDMEQTKLVLEQQRRLFAHMRTTC